MKDINFNKGQTLVELLIVIALLAILLPAIVMGLIASRDGKPQQEKRVQASQLMKESGEVVRIIREGGWANIETNGTFHPESSGTEWTLASGSETINGITRQIVISDVYRDSVTNAIVETGGVLDPSTKKIELSASWLLPIPSSLDSTFYLTRYLDNATYIQTTGGYPEADFNTGTHTGTNVVSNEGGEVVLGAGGYGDWCSPNESIVATLNLPGNGVAEAVSAIEGNAFTGTGGNSSGESFVSIAISNDNPPNLSVAGTIDGYKTNDVFIIGSYALIATDDKQKDVVIIDLANNSEIGYYNGSNGLGNYRAEGVFAVGSTGYVVIGTSLQTFDLSSFSGSRPGLDSEFLWGLGQDVYVVGDYAYVAVEYFFAEMRLVNVANPSNISLAARADVNGERGMEVYINETGTRAYLATDESLSKDELFIINTDFPASNKNNSNFTLPVISSYDANGMDPRGLTGVPGNKIILVGLNGEEYQVIDVSNESLPVRCGGLEIGSGLYGVASVLEADGDVYSYVVSKDNENEFKVIRGGPGGSYSNEGVYESATFEIGYSTAFNRIIPNYDTPINTSVQFRIAIADPVSGSCSGANYVFTGYDGTDQTYYTGEDNIKFDNDGIEYENPARCFRYRAYLHSDDSSATPIFKDISINYSP